MVVFAGSIVKNWYIERVDTCIKRDRIVLITRWRRRGVREIGGVDKGKALFGLEVLFALVSFIKLEYTLLVGHFNRGDSQR